MKSFLKSKSAPGRRQAGRLGAQVKGREEWECRAARQEQSVRHVDRRGEGVAAGGAAVARKNDPVDGFAEPDAQGAAGGALEECCRQRTGHRADDRAACCAGSCSDAELHAG